MTDPMRRSSFRSRPSVARRAWLLVPWLVAASPASAQTVYSQDFQGNTSLTGWSTAASDSSGSLTIFLGRFGGSALTTVSLTLDLEPSTYCIDFDYYLIDSWDGPLGSEQVSFTLNGTVAFSGAPASWCVDPDWCDGFAVPSGTSTGFYGFSQFTDAILPFRFVFTVPPLSASATSPVPFVWTSSGLESLSDESWGLDNVLVRNARWYEDKDGDGFGDTYAPPVISCAAPADTGYALNALDCDDSDAMIWVDADGDGICDNNDPCVGSPNFDSDGDGVCNSDDPCVGFPNDDADNDGTCDSEDPCVGFPNDDADGDGICDVDLCPLGSPDTDGDGICDGGDLCVGDDATGDTDGDGVCDDLDPCDGDDATGDTDGDGICGTPDDDEQDPGYTGGACDGCSSGGNPVGTLSVVLGAVLWLTRNQSTKMRRRALFRLTRGALRSVRAGPRRRPPREGVPGPHRAAGE